MAISNTGLTPGLSKRTAFGFQLQDVEGTQVSDSILWLPVDGTVDFRRRGNRTFHRQADYVDGEHLHYSAGQWAQGSIPFILPANATALTALFSWIFDRDDYNQGALASVYKYSSWAATPRRESWIDAKVEEARFTFEKGRPVGLSLSICARKPGTWSGSPDMLTVGGPLLYKETKAEIDVDGETLAVTRELERAEIVHNNDVENPAEGLRLCYDDDGGTYPAHIYNKGAAMVSGRLSRDFVNDTYGAAFLSQLADDFGDSYDGTMKFTVARGGVGFTLQANRVQWLDGADGPDYPGSNDARLTQDIEWHALMENTATTPTGPIAYTITGA